jgi:hypothetical protein
MQGGATLPLKSPAVSVPGAEHEILGEPSLYGVRTGLRGVTFEKQETALESRGDWRRLFGSRGAKARLRLCSAGPQLPLKARIAAKLTPERWRLGCRGLRGGG